MFSFDSNNHLKTVHGNLLSVLTEYFKEAAKNGIPSITRIFMDLLDRVCRPHAHMKNSFFHIKPL